MNQKIKEEKMNIDIVDRMKQIEIQENEIERRSKELGKIEYIHLVSLLLQDRSSHYSNSKCLSNYFYPTSF